MDVADFFSLLGGGEGGPRRQRGGEGVGLFIENPRRGGGLPGERGGGARGREGPKNSGNSMSLRKKKP